jgi:hypothetical protein
MAAPVAGDTAAFVPGIEEWVCGIVTYQRWLASGCTEPRWIEDVFRSIGLKVTP